MMLATVTQTTIRMCPMPRVEYLEQVSSNGAFPVTNIKYRFNVHREYFPETQVVSCNTLLFIRNSGF